MMPHPIRRWASAIAAIALAVMTLAGVSSSASADDAFQTWLQSMWPEAEKLGVSRATFEAATRGLTPDLSLPDLVIPGRPEAPPVARRFTRAQPASSEM